MKLQDSGLVQIILMSVCTTCCATVQADQVGALDWLEAHSVQVRKSFSGSLRDAGAPATIAYENPAAGADFYRADLGIRTKAVWEYDPPQVSRVGMRLQPTIEFHRSTQRGEEINKQGGALTFEHEFGSDPDFSRTLVTDVKLELEHDSVRHQTTRILVGRLAIAGVDPGWPGAWVRNGNSEEVLRYYLSIGAERYTKLAIEKKVSGQTVQVAPSINADLAFVRLNVELRLLPSLTDGRLVFVGSQTLRQKLNGGTVVSRSLRLLEGSLDYYVDDKRRVAFGVAYQRGQDPARNLLDEEFSSVGLKLKIGD